MMEIGGTIEARICPHCKKRNRLFVMTEFGKESEFGCRSCVERKSWISSSDFDLEYKRFLKREINTTRGIKIRGVWD